ncbi:MAG: hypothetical protein IT368_15100 [Candidatus Hydrogenedentes bacterium]|nr:hypothetical protein [Candidatus Hydrogenedentota bacterium]
MLFRGTVPAIRQQSHLVFAQTTGTVDILTFGVYPIQYAAEDSVGSYATATRYLPVDDTLPPTLAMNGPAPRTGASI